MKATDTCIEENSTHFIMFIDLYIYRTSTQVAMEA